MKTRSHAGHIVPGDLSCTPNALDSTLASLYADGVRRVALHRSDERRSRPTLRGDAASARAWHRQCPHSTDRRPRGRKLPGSFLCADGNRTYVGYSPGQRVSTYVTATMISATSAATTVRKTSSGQTWHHPEGSFPGCDLKGSGDTEVSPAIWAGILGRS